MCRVFLYVVSPSTCSLTSGVVVKVQVPIFFIISDPRRLSAQKDYVGTNQPIQRSNFDDRRQIKTMSNEQASRLPQIDPVLTIACHFHSLLLLRREGGDSREYQRIAMVNTPTARKNFTHLPKMPFRRLPTQQSWDSSTNST